MRKEINNPEIEQKLDDIMAYAQEQINKETSWGDHKSTVYGIAMFANGDVEVILIPKDRKKTPHNGLVYLRGEYKPDYDCDKDPNIV